MSDCYHVWLKSDQSKIVTQHGSGAGRLACAHLFSLSSLCPFLYRTMSSEMRAMMEAITKLTRAMTDMQQSGSGNRGGQPGINADRKKIDMRYIKVQEFEGKTEDWDTWSFSFKGGIRAQDKRAYDLIGKVEQLVVDMDENGLDPNTEAISGELYNVLCQYCRGPAQSILRSVEDCCGLTAWQKLHRVYNPMTVARTIQALGEVTRPPKVTDCP